VCAMCIQEMLSGPKRIENVAVRRQNDLPALGIILCNNFTTLTHF